MIRAKTYATEREARDAIAIEDTHRGYPRTEPGIRRGSGLFAPSITTISAAEPFEIEGGGYAVPIEAMTAPELDTKNALDVKRREPSITLASAPVVRVIR